MTYEFIIKLVRTIGHITSNLTLEVSAYGNDEESAKKNARHKVTTDLNMNDHQNTWKIDSVSVGKIVA